MNALAQSRGVSDRDLFESAIDFFSGQALKWYYAQRSQISSWAELSERLISDFVEVNYYDNLLDTIRQRKQTTNESIVQFFTIFEDNCSRLQKSLSSNEKILETMVKRLSSLVQYQLYSKHAVPYYFNELCSKHAVLYYFNDFY